MPKKKKEKIVFRIWKSGKWYIIAVIVIGLLYSLLKGDFGLIKYYELSREKSRLQAELYILRSEIDSLKIVIKKLDSDLQYIEKIAREKYNMVKDGETIYQIVPKKE